MALTMMYCYMSFWFLGLAWPLSCTVISNGAVIGFLFRSDTLEPSSWMLAGGPMALEDTNLDTQQQIENIVKEVFLSHGAIQMSSSEVMLKGGTLSY